MKKVGGLSSCMEVGKCFKLFYGSIFYLAVRGQSFNSMIITERLNSCTTKLVQCAPRVIVMELNEQAISTVLDKHKIFAKVLHPLIKFDEKHDGVKSPRPYSKPFSR